MVYEILKRNGLLLSPVPGAPFFDLQAEAETWVASFRLANPDAIKAGIETILVRLVSRDIVFRR